MSLPGYTWKCGMKNTDIKLQTLQDKDLVLTFETIIRGSISSVMGVRYVESDEKEKILYIDANICRDRLWVNIYLMMKLNLIEMLI